LTLQLKVMNKFERGVGRVIFVDIFKHPLWNLSITFRWSVKTSKLFLEMKLSLIPQFFLYQSFLKKDTLLCLNEIWNLFLNTFSAFSQGYEQWSSSF
jgi:hypothetical protein